MYVVFMAGGVHLDCVSAVMVSAAVEALKSMLPEYMRIGIDLVCLQLLQSLCSLHFQPYLCNSHTQIEPLIPSTKPISVNAHPFPSPSIRGCNAATVIADSAHLMILLEAPAAPDFPADISTISVLKSCRIMVHLAPMKN
jgi:hypothetical protein